jgi:hypothetical protein
MCNCSGSFCDTLGFVYAVGSKRTKTDNFVVENELREMRKDQLVPLQLLRAIGNRRDVGENSKSDAQRTQRAKPACLSWQGLAACALWTSRALVQLAPFSPN